MAGNTGLGGFTYSNVGEFSAQEQRKPSLARNLTELNTQDNKFRQDTSLSPIEQLNIRRQDLNMARREGAEDKLANSGLVAREQFAESQQEGDVAFGKIGKNHPGDTRMAQVFKALGVAPDLMSAIIASAQIRQSDNR